MKTKIDELANERKWYAEVPYADVKKIISANIKSMSQSFIAVGYYLKYVRDNDLYREDGYNTIWEFAEDLYGIKMSTASRWMTMNDRFSKDGNSPVIADEYKEFGKSHLQEMLALPEEDYKMITPEATKEEIRELARFNKENENNPSRLINWQQSEDEALENAILEFFRERKDSLNRLYSSESYEKNDIPEMAAVVCNKQKKTFKTKDNSVFIVLYETEVHVKDCAGEARDIEWEQFFAITRKLFDGHAEGDKTWENYFTLEKKEPDPEDEQIPGQDSILDHPEYMPAPEPQGKLHGKKFPNCIYKGDEECISESCDQCQKKKEYEKEEKEKRQWTEEEAVEVFAENSPNKVKKIMEICRENKPQDRAKAVQKHFAPYGFSGSSHGGYSESFWGFAQGVRLEFEGKRISLKYGRLVEELLKLYDPYAPEFMPKDAIAPAQKKNCIHRPEFPCTLSEAQMVAAGDGIDCNSKCCWNCPNHGLCGYECNSSAHRPDEEVIDSTAVEVTEIIEETEEEAAEMQQIPEKRCENSSSIPDEWPRDLHDIPIPSMALIQNILRKQEETMKLYLEECDGIPYETLMKEKLITGGLRLIRNLVFDIQESKYE